MNRGNEHDLLMESAAAAHGELAPRLQPVA